MRDGRDSGSLSTNPGSGRRECYGAIFPHLSSTVPICESYTTLVYARDSRRIQNSTRRDEPPPSWARPRKWTRYGTISIGEHRAHSLLQIFSPNLLQGMRNVIKGSTNASVMQDYGGSFPLNLSRQDSLMDGSRRANCS